MAQPANPPEPDHGHGSPPSPVRRGPDPGGDPPRGGDDGATGGRRGRPAEGPVATPGASPRRRTFVTGRRSSDGSCVWFFPETGGTAAVPFPGPWTLSLAVRPG